MSPRIFATRGSPLSRAACSMMCTRWFRLVAAVVEAVAEGGLHGIVRDCERGHHDTILVEHTGRVCSVEQDGDRNHRSATPAFFQVAGLVPERSAALGGGRDGSVARRPSTLLPEPG